MSGKVAADPPAYCSSAYEAEYAYPAVRSIEMSDVVDVPPEPGWALRKANADQCV